MEGGGGGGSSPSQVTCTNGTVVPNPAANAALVKDCVLLLTLKTTLEGSTSRRLNWSETRSMESWEGVTVDDSPQRVVKLELGGKTLKGRIPPTLNQLAGLQTLDLSNNELTGAIPVGLRQLAHLQVLDFSRNRLTGSTPTDLGSLAQLRTLALAHNRLTGNIPPQLGNLSRLRVLYMAGNQCGGCIPNALTRVADHDLSDIELPLCDPVTPRAKSTSTPNATATSTASGGRSSIFLPLVRR